VSVLRRQVKVTHPFHPLFGIEFELIGYMNSWKKSCVQLADENGVQTTLPLEWTDAADIDVFLHISQGRSHFRIEELLRLAELIAAISSTA
jgi:hypothetical protein